ncbi:hypothetical protein MGG_17807 [Pyricularia oryzae 70-15]|uniref:Uncharacterized protein n=1 Tax=Pyricularia oryzae (strain 70-15 / ATCC MYA-4617 / FGSC 8958) TaxID=242507 RepID=G4NI61_PYRO7|nr:uncharacterized protein MGG_17807 [Pyricularia oryzae 70-15]EHA47921.1 hypothetical protein MGG_17807 [Pyricularia oryzae 70-15]
METCHCGPQLVLLRDYMSSEIPIEDSAVRAGCSQLISSFNALSVARGNVFDTESS